MRSRENEKSFLLDNSNEKEEIVNIKEIRETTEADNSQILSTMPQDVMNILAFQLHAHNSLKLKCYRHAYATDEYQSYIAKLDKLELKFYFPALNFRLVARFAQTCKGIYKLLSQTPAYLQNQRANNLQPSLLIELIIRYPLIIGISLGTLGSVLQGVSIYFGMVSAYNAGILPDDETVQSAIAGGGCVIGEVGVMSASYVGMNRFFTFFHNKKMQQLNEQKNIRKQLHHP